MRFFLAPLCLLLVATNAVVAQDWPQWRGPTGDNHAPAGTTAPVEWGEETKFAWKSLVPGRGHSSPTIVGDFLYLTTADTSRDTQSLLIYDRHSGELLKETVAHRGGLTAQLHPHNTHASSTVASDGQRVFALFLNDDVAWVTAFDLQGKQLWQQRALGFDPQRFEFGFGSSPVVIDGLVIVASEYDGSESGLIALDTATGEQRWKTDRPQSLSYSTPARASSGGKQYLLQGGNQQIAAYDPQTGEEMWSTEGTTYATCGTMVWSEPLGMAFASGGYPDKFALGVRTEGDHKIVWQDNRIKCYEQSLLLVGEQLYAVTDNGIAYCLRASDGEVLWKQRLAGGFSSSPLLVDGKIYVTNEGGITFVFNATPDGYEPLGQNRLGTECFATPTPVGNQLYHRYAKGTGDERQEFLVAIGDEYE